MQIHELNGFSGTLGSGAYIAVDDGSDTGKVSTQKLLEKVNNDIDNLSDSLNARIDNIIAGGSAPSVAEVTDARLGVNENSYPSLGVAIRSQAGNLQNDLISVSDDIYSETELDPAVTVDSYKLLETGYSAADNSSELLKYIVTEGQTLRVDSDDNFQFQNAVTSPSSGNLTRIGETYRRGPRVVKVPAGATHLVVSTLKEGSTAKVYDCNNANAKLLLDSHSLSLEWISGGTISSDGSIASRTGFSYTPYIKVPNNVQISGIFQYVPTGSFYIGCYDSGKQFIEGLLPGAGNNTRVKQAITLPTGTSFIRICNYTSQKDSVRLYIYNNEQAAFLNDENLLNIDKTAFGLNPAENPGIIEYNTNSQVLICDLGEELSFGSVTIRMRMTGVIGKNNTASLFRFEKADGTSIYKTYAQSGFMVDREYSGVFDSVFDSIAFRKIYLYPYTGSYINFTAGEFSDFIVFDSYGVYDKLTSSVKPFPTNIQDSISGGLDRIAYTYATRNTFGVITDIHENYPAYRYLESVSKNRLFYSLLVLGDLNNASEATLESTKAEMLKTAYALSSVENYSKVLPMRGNHDGVLNSDSYTSEMFTSAVIKPFVYWASDIGNYYYDDPANKIRFIMMNDCADEFSRLGFSSETIEFLSDSLASVPNGFSVITATHHPLINVTSTEIPVNADQVIDILEEYKANNPDTYICHVYGHMHYDKIETQNSVTYVGVTASNIVSSNFALDVFCIDKSNRVVNIVRIGDAGTDREFTY